MQVPVVLYPDEISKEDKYRHVLTTARGVIQGETSLIANLANIAAILKDTFHWWWVGFYLVEGDELVLGPFQGPVACTRIAFGKGVCGTAWKEGKSIPVPDVEAFPGHIACSAESKSEIVVPVFKNNAVVAVLDADSEYYNSFDTVDEQFLEELATIISDCFWD